MKKIFITVFLSCLFLSNVWGQVPTITSFTPTFGAVGTSVTITGTNFNAVVGGNSVYFGAVKATVTAESATSITVNVPLGATSVSPILVRRNDNGLQVSSERSVTGLNARYFRVVNTPNLPLNSSSYKQEVTSTGAGTAPRGVKLVELNADGKLDRVVAYQTTGQIAVEMGNGDGTFGAVSTFTVGSQPQEIVFGYFNNDANMDIAVTNWGSTDISVLLGDGGGSFAAAVNYGSGGTSPEGLVAADFNNDGKTDLAVSNYNGQNFGILLGAGDGTFGAVSTVSLSVNTKIKDIKAADFDGDGDIDIAVVNNDEVAPIDQNNIQIYLNNGAGAMTLYSTNALANDKDIKKLAIADFNNDNRMDMAVLADEFVNYEVAVLLGNGSGGVSSTNYYSTSGGGNGFAIEVGDFDEDGDIDVVRGTYSLLGIMLNNGAGALTTVINMPFTDNTVACLGLAVGDIDNNGKAEIIASKAGVNQLITFSMTAFKTTWQTAVNGESITIPVEPATNYNCWVNWGDGSAWESFSGVAPVMTHSYATAGTYTVSILGNFPRIHFNNAGDKLKIRTIEQWGTIPWTSMANAFQGCSNLQLNATDAPILSGVNSLQFMFEGCTAFTGNASMNTWNTSTINVMAYVFQGCTNFNANITSWNVSSVTDMRGMFVGTKFNQNIGGWNVSSATNMQSLFQGASLFNQDISNWNTQNVSDMQQMFQNASAFNNNGQPLPQVAGKWNVSNVTNMWGMFQGATTFNQDVSSWNVSNVDNMQELFEGATNFNQSLASWTLKSGVGAVSMNNMLNNCGMNTANYDATLIAWAGQAGLPTNVTFGAAGRTYCAATSARNNTLATSKNWTISGDSPSCPTFYSRQTGNWNDVNTWSLVACGGAQTVAGITPSAFHDVVICNTHTVSLTQAEACANLTISSDGTLNVGAFNFTANGTSSITGIFNDAENGGTNTFKGLLTVNAGGRFLASAFPNSNSTFVFEGGITNNATANTDFDLQHQGGTIFNTNDQTITANRYMRIGAGGFGNVDVNVNLTLISNPITTASEIRWEGGDFNIAANKTVSNQGYTTIFYKNLFAGNAASTWLNDVNSYVHVRGTDGTIPMNGGVFNVSAPGNTVEYGYNGAGVVRGGITYHNLEVAYGDKTLTGGDIIVNGNLTIQSNATATTFLANGNNIDLKGNWINNQNFTAGTGTVTLNGTAFQTVGGTASTTFGLLTIDNPTEIRINQNTNVSTTLNMTQGKIILINNNLTLTNATPASQLSGTFSNTNYIATLGTGRFIRNGNTVGSFQFPVGDATNLKLLTLSNINNTGIRYVANPTVPSIPVGLYANGLNGLWDITNAATNNTTLRMSNAGGSTSATSALRQHNGTSWLPIATTYNAVPTYHESTTAQNLSPAASFWAVLSPSQTLYARANGDWNDGNTWSLMSSSGAACGCTPLPNDQVIIENGWTVTQTANNQLDGTSIAIGTSVGSGVLNLQNFTNGTVTALASFASAANQFGAVRLSAGNNLTVTTNAFWTNDFATVEFNGGTFNIPNTFAGQNYPNLVISAATKTLAGNTVVNRDLRINPTASLEVSSFDLTVNRQSHILGIWNDGTSGGTNTFQGKITVAGNGEFRKPIASSNTFVFNHDIEVKDNALFDLRGNGATTFSGTNPQTITHTSNNALGSIFFGRSSGVGNIAVNQNLVLAGNRNIEFQVGDDGSFLIGAGRVVTNNNTSEVVIAGGDLNGTDADSEWINNAFTTLSITANKNPVMSVGKLTATANPNTVRYLSSQTNIPARDIKATTYHHLVTNNFIKQLTGATTVNGDFTALGSVANSFNTEGHSFTVLGNFTNQATTSLLTSSLNIGGNLINNGNIAAQNSTVTFNGTSFQTIGGSNSTNFQNLIINNPNNVRLDRASVVSATLNLINGRLILNNVNLTYRGNNLLRTNGFVQTQTASAAGSFVQDSLSLYGANNYLFPVGTDTEGYTPLFMNYTATAPSVAHSVRALRSVALPSPNNAKVLWEITKASATNNPTLTFDWQIVGNQNGTFTTATKVQFASSPYTSWTPTNVAWTSGTSIGGYVLPSVSAVRFAVFDAPKDYYTLNTTAWNSLTKWSTDGTNACACVPDNFADVNLHIRHNTTLDNANRIGNNNTVIIENLNTQFNLANIIPNNTFVLNTDATGLGNQQTLLAASTGTAQISGGDFMDFANHTVQYDNGAANYNIPELVGGKEYQNLNINTGTNIRTLNLTANRNINGQLNILGNFRLTGNGTLNSVPAGSTAITFQGGEVDLTDANAKLFVNGTLVNTSTGTSTINSLPATLEFASATTAIYEHNRNGGAIPLATWGASSTTWIRGITTANLTGGLNQTFGNFTWDCDGQNFNYVFGANMTVQNNFSVLNTGTNAITLTNTTHTLSTKNLIINPLVGKAARFYLANNSLGTLNITGDFNNAITPAGTAVFGVQASGNGVINFNGANQNQIFNPPTFNKPATQVVNINVNKTGLPNKVLVKSHNLDFSGTNFSVLNISQGVFALAENTAQNFKIDNLEGTVNGTLEMTGAAHSFTISGDNSLTYLGNLLTDTNPSTITYGGTNMQNVFPSPNYRNLVIGGSLAKNLQGNTTINNNLTISGGGFGLGNHTVQLKGNLTRTSGTFAQGTSSFIMNGTSFQTITGGITFYNFEIDNPNNISLALATPAVVTNNFTLTNGKLIINNNNFTISQLTGGSNANYVVTNGTGNLIRNGLVASTNYLFPIGNSINSYTPFFINYATNPSATTQVRVSPRTALANPFPAAPKRADVGWTITKPVELATLTFDWTNAQAAELVGTPFATADQVRPSTYTGTWNPAINGSYHAPFSTATVSEVAALSAAQFAMYNSCPVITMPTLFSYAPLNVAYSQSIAATGGVAPYTYAVIVGTLPAGLSLNPSTGQITGTPTALGTYSFIAQSTDNGGCIATQNYTLNVEHPIESPRGNIGLYFDGIDDYVNVPHNASLNPTQVTVEAWIKPSKINATTPYHSIIAKESANNGYAIRIGDGGKVDFGIGHNVPLGSTVATSAGIEVYVNQWAHVAGTYDGTTLKTYVNGNLVASTPFSGSIGTGSTNPLNIGKSSGFPNREFAGQIDEVRVFNYARTQEQIRQDMLTQTANGAVAYWNLDQATGTTATDLSGNGNNGTLAGGTQTPLWAFRVKNTNDTGAESMRDVIANQANTNADLNYIDFSIPTFDANNVSGVCTIMPLSNLPQLSNPVIIDGYSQLNAVKNTLSVGNNADLRIQLNGADARTLGLNFGAGAEFSTVQGLVINRFTNSQIALNGNNIGVFGNFIGTDVAGTAGLGSTGAKGILVNGVNQSNIGSPDMAHRNIISGFGLNGFGISIEAFSNGTKIYNNYIGTQKNGISAITNPQSIGIQIGGTSINTLVGGTNVNLRNIIGSNSNVGIKFMATAGVSQGHVIYGNYIGLGADGLANVGNNVGVLVTGGVGLESYNNTIGGINAGEGNTITNNFNQGIQINEAQQVRNIIRGNSIYCNGTLGIELSNNGNNNQAIPVVTLMTPNTISGTGTVAGNNIDVYIDNSACSPKQGRQYVGSTTVGAGLTWSFTTAGGFGTFNNITLTQTNFPTNGTSAFTTAYQLLVPKILAISPTVGEVGSLVFISGTGFDSTPAFNTVWFGGVRATNITSSGSNFITVQVPLGASSLSEVTVGTKSGFIAKAPQLFDVSFTTGVFVTANYAPAVDFAGLVAFSKDMVSGDFDGDGKIDIAVGNNGSNGGIRIFRNNSINGNVSFTHIATLGAFNVAGMAVGDLNGDGKLDLIGTREANPQMFLFQNNSTGIGNFTFGGAITIATPTTAPNFAYDVDIADMDDDGKLDLIITSQTNNTTRSSVYRNIDNNGILAATDFVRTDISHPSSGMGTMLEVADVNGDNKPDLLIPNLGQSNFSVYTNNSTVGNISLPTRNDYAVLGTSPYDIEVVDFDGDGKRDVVFSNTANNSISVVLNTNTVAGVTSFAATPSLTIDVGATSTYLETGDVDGDGKTDILVRNGARVTILRNTSTIGNLSFSERTMYGFNGAGEGLLLTDLDNDNYPDLAIANGTTNNLQVFRYDPRPLLFDFYPKSVTAGQNLFITGNFFGTNSDFATVYIGGVVAPITSFGNTFITVTVPNGASTYSPISIIFKNKDAQVNSLELPTNQFLNVRFTTVLDITASTFAKRTDYTTEANGGGLYVGDLDGDGKNDVATPSGNKIYLYRNITTAGQSTAFAPPTTLTTTGNLFEFKAADIDNDGRVDLCIVNQGSNMVSLFQNTSTAGTISFNTRYDINLGVNPRSINIQDIDGDKKLDLLIGQNTSTNVFVLRNTHTGGNFSATSFSNSATFNISSNMVEISTGADIDRDGKMDFIHNGQGGTNNLSVFHNQAIFGAINTASLSRTDFALGAAGHDAKVADMNGDGLTDVLTGLLSTNRFSIFRNTNAVIGTPSFARQDFTTSGGSQTLKIGTGDIDSDGKPDIVAVNRGTNQIVYYPNTSSGGVLTLGTAIPYPTLPLPYEAMINDMNGDNRAEIILGYGNGFSIYEYAPSAPLTLAATNTSFTSATVNFQTVNPNHQHIIEIANNANFSPVLAFQTVAAGNSSFNFAGLTPNTLYYARTKAYDGISFSTVQNVKVFYTNEPIGGQNALSFDGTTNYLDLGNLVETNLVNNFTVEAWIKPNSVAGVQRIFARNDALSGWGLGINGQNILFTAFGTGAGGDSQGAGNLIQVGQWVHIAAVHEGATTKLYLNGVLNANLASNNVILNNNLKATIGASHLGTAHFFNGQVDEVRFWNTPRSQTQIQDMMCRRLEGTEPNLVSYFRLDEQSPFTTAENKAKSSSTDAYFVNSPTFVTSGAAIGDISVHQYGAGTTLSLNDTDIFTANGFNLAANEGVQIYKVRQSPNFTAAVPQFTTIESSRYFGVFPVGIPNYKVNYDYSNNSNITTNSNKDITALAFRTDGSVNTWGLLGSSNNSTLEFISSRIVNNRSEVMVGFALPSVNLFSTVTPNAFVLQNTDSHLLHYISATASINSVKFLSVQIQTSGTYVAGDIKPNGFKLWQTDSPVFATTTLLAQANSSSTGTGETITFTPATSPQLHSDQTRYFWLTMDLSPSATRGNTIFASAIPFTSISFTTATLTGTNPISGGGFMTIVDQYTVTNLNPNGAGSLSNAITQANSAAGFQTVTFMLNPSLEVGGAYTISGILPNITDGILIDGFTQTGSSPNTLHIGNNAIIKIQIQGTGTGNGISLAAGSSGSVIKGLAINQFNVGVNVAVGSNNNRIEGNFIGTNTAGTGVLANTNVGVLVNSNFNTIGGFTTASRNLIAGNTHKNIALNNATYNYVANNYVGTNRHGTSNLGGNIGVFLENNAQNNQIGGTTLLERNVITGNNLVGIDVTDIGNNTNNKIIGNLIGVQANAINPSGNTQAGMLISSQFTSVGGFATAEGNIISDNQNGIVLRADNTWIGNNKIGVNLTNTALGNSQNGILADASSQISTIIFNTIAFNAQNGIYLNNANANRTQISQNSIFANTNLGINLNGLGNNNKAMPFISVLSAAVVSGTSQPNDVIEIFRDNISTNTQGREFLGTATTNLAGNWAFTTTGIMLGDKISATARDINNNTSQFATASYVLPVITSFSPLNATAGTSLTISGTGFSYTNNSVYFGSTKANITAQSPNSITVTVPNGAIVAPIQVTTQSGFVALSKQSFTPASNLGTLTPIETCSFTKDGQMVSGLNIQRPQITADLDGDGKTDLIATSYNTPKKLSIFPNASTPTNMSLGSEVIVDNTFLGADLLTHVFARDLNGDGKLDLVVSTATGGAVRIYRNTSTGIGNFSFSNEATCTVGAETDGLDLVDVDADGKLDIVIANQSGNIVTVLKNTSNPHGAISMAPAVNYTTGAIQAVNFRAADINGDNKPDLVVSDNQSNNIRILINQATQGIVDAATFAAATTFDVGATSQSIQLIDLNNDTQLDMIVNLETAAQAKIYSNNGTGIFTLQQTLNNFRPRTGNFLADLNGDGKPDLTGLNTLNNGTIIYPNTSTGTAISFGTPTTLLNMTTVANVIAADFNNDGKTDLISQDVANNFVLYRYAPQNFVLNPTTLPNGEVGMAFGTAINFATASNNTPYTYALATGSLPNGLSFNSSTLFITGIATLSGTYNFMISATDGQGCVASQNYTINIAPATPTILAATNVSKTSFTANWTATAGATSYQVELSENPTFMPLTAFQTVNSNSTTFANLSTNTVYYFRVRASNGALSNFSTTKMTSTILPAGSGNNLNFGTNPSLSFQTALVSGAKTISFWIKPNSNARQVIYDDNGGATGVNARGTTLFVWDGGIVRAMTHQNTPILDFQGTKNIADGKWHHVAFVWDGTAAANSAKIYVDGLLDNQASPLAIQSNAPVYTTLIGRYADGNPNYRLNSQIDEIRVWNIAQNQTQIRDLMCQKIIGTETGLLAYLRLDENTGTITENKAQNSSQDVLLVNSPNWTISGAALGDIATYTYTGNSLALNDTDIFRASFANLVANQGIHIYKVRDIPNFTSVPSNFTTIDFSRYFGIFPIGISNTNLVYDYTNNSNLNTNTSQIGISWRTDNTNNAWNSILQSENPSNKTISINSFADRGEFLAGFGLFNVAPDILLIGDRIDEGADIGTQIGFITVIDPDIGDVHTIEFLPNAGDNQFFTFKDGKLYSKIVFSYIQRNNYTVGFRVTDRFGVITNRSFFVYVNMPFIPTNPFSPITNGMVVPVNYNADAHIDIIISGNSTNGVIGNVGTNYGAGIEFGSVSLPNISNEYGHNIAVGDFNNDNIPDIVMTGSQNGVPTAKILSYKNGKFEEFPNTNLQPVLNSSVSVGDFNNDGLMDIIIIGQKDGKPHSQLYQNLGNARFITAKQDIVHVQRGTVRFTDIDNDGYLDFYVSGQNTDNQGVTLIYKNNQNQTFTPSNYALPQVQLGQADFQDFNNDSYPDLLLSGFDGTKPIAAIYRNNAGNSFTKIQDLEGVQRSAVAWGDYNNDGFSDALIMGIANGTSVTKMYHNNLGTDFKYFADFVGLSNGSATFVDMDNDRDLDIIISGRAQNQQPYTYLYNNQTKNKNTIPTRPHSLSFQANATEDGKTELLMSWQPSLDRENTEAKGLSFNIFIRDDKGNLIVSPLSNFETGKRHISSDRGNTLSLYTHKIQNIPYGNYTFGVQAIDAGFEASPFALFNNGGYITLCPPVKDVQTLEAKLSEKCMKKGELLKDEPAFEGEKDNRKVKVQFTSSFAAGKSRVKLSFRFKAKNDKNFAGVQLAKIFEGENFITADTVVLLKPNTEYEYFAELRNECGKTKSGDVFKIRTPAIIGDNLLIPLVQAVKRNQVILPIKDEKLPPSTTDTAFTTITWQKTRTLETPKWENIKLDSNMFVLDKIRFDSTLYIRRIVTTEFCADTSNFVKVNILQNSVLPSDSLLLVEIYQNTKGEKWNNSWDLSKEVSTWEGVEIEEGRVVGISLGDNNLVGDLTKLLLNDNNVIRFLNLSGNQLTGQIPDVLSKLRNLEVLNLSKNQFEGEVPKFLGNLKYLTTLYLNDNRLESIHPDLSKATQLQSLFLGNNKIKVLPDELSLLTKLRILNVRGNFIEVIPPSYANLVELEYLDISDNEFRYVSQWVNTLTKLKGFYLHTNYIKDLPDLSNLRRLQIMEMHSNYLDFEDLQKLRTPAKLDYAPQHRIGYFVDTLVYKNRNVQIGFVINGTNNKVQWFKEGRAIDESPKYFGTQHNYLTINEISEKESGIYYFEVKNSQFPDLVLRSHEVMLRTDCGELTPKINITVQGKTLYCTNENIKTQLSTTLTQSENYSFQWLRNGVPMVLANSHEWTATQTGVYTLLITDKNNCTYLLKDSVKIHKVEDSKVILIQQNNVLEAQSAATATAFAWFLNGQRIAYTTENRLSVPQNGNYQVMLITQNGCQISSEQRNITITATEKTNFGLQVYPNPTKNTFYIEAPQIALYEVSVYDVLGKRMSVPMHQNSERLEIHLESLPNAVYVVKVQKGAKVQVFRIAKE